MADAVGEAKNYYDIVWKELEETCPDGNYFADWTADELFVIFYQDDDSSRVEVIQNAMTFAHKLATKVHSQLANEIGMTLTYDIGISAGQGMLGLLGPDKRMKTTIASEVAGVAKRLETEAKHQRTKNKLGVGKSGESIPVIAVSGDLIGWVKQAPIFSSGEIILVTPETKDLEGDILLWQQDGFIKAVRAIS